MLVLIQKYHREQRAPQDRAAGEWTPASADPPVDSIAHFALYLSGVVLQPAPLTIAELGSVQVLLQVMYAAVSLEVCVWIFANLLPVAATTARRSSSWTRPT